MIDSIRVRLQLTSTADGGRPRGVASGYRPSWRSQRKPAHNDATLELDGDEPLLPGGEAECTLKPMSPQLWEGLVEPGDNLECLEGMRVVGRATCLSVHETPPGLKRTDAE